jgi:hypothetical protein
VRRALLQLAKGTANPELFTPEFRAEVFPKRAEKLGEILNSLSLPVAVIHLSELVEQRNENNLRVFHYLLTDIGKTLSCVVKLTSDNKIAALEIESRE